ncbi:hypothetical protein YC2023_004593 [Brassica napus]
MLWLHSHAIANHFPIGHPSFHYSRSSTLNSGVLSGCVPKKNTTSLLRPTTGLKTPLWSELRWLVSFDTTCSKSLFTDPTITTRPFPMLWLHSHAIANHFPIGHPFFHYSSSSTLNSRVLSGCVPEKEMISWSEPFSDAFDFVCDFPRFVINKIYLLLLQKGIYWPLKSLGVVLVDIPEESNSATELLRLWWFDLDRGAVEMLLQSRNVRIVRWRLWEHLEILGGSIVFFVVDHAYHGHECHFVVGAGNKLSGFDDVSSPSLCPCPPDRLLEDLTQALSILQARSSLGSTSSYHSCREEALEVVVHTEYLWVLTGGSRCRPLHFFDFRSDRSGGGKLGGFECGLLRARALLRWELEESDFLAPLRSRILRIGCTLFFCTVQIDLGLTELGRLGDQNSSSACYGLRVLSVKLDERDQCHRGVMAHLVRYLVAVLDTI